MYAIRDPVKTTIDGTFLRDSHRYLRTQGLYPMGTGDVSIPAIRNPVEFTIQTSYPGGMKEHQVIEFALALYDITKVMSTLLENESCELRNRGCSSNI